MTGSTTPTPMPPLPDPDFSKFGQGTSLLGGWLPWTVEIVTVVVLMAAIGWRTRRWRLLWVPLSVALGVAAALFARTYMDSEGLAGDPAPIALWGWIAACAAAVPLAVLGFRGAAWWRRALAVSAVPLTMVCVLLTIDAWVGYYTTVQRAWADVTSGRLPDQIDDADLGTLRNTMPTSGKVLRVDVDSSASGFRHRSEYVYLPPTWFTGATPPALPVLMMITGEFGNPTNWMRTGNAIETVDAFAKAHAGAAPVLVFVDSSGSFNNDTECVNGPRGAAADHLTKDVRPFVIDRFGAAPEPARWGVVGWSMGGTCAIDLTVMHPDMFRTFDDIGGDRGPNSGTKEQTINRLYGGDAAAWAAFDPRTVMARHGPYTGVAGYFDDSVEPADDKTKKLPQRTDQHRAPVGFGGHDDADVWREKGALPELCAAAVAVDVECSLRVYPGYHTWQLAAQAFKNALPWLAQRLAA